MPVGALDAAVVRALVPVGPGWTGKVPVGNGAADVARVEVVTAAAVVVVVTLAVAADVLALTVVAAGATDSVACLVKPAGRVMPLAAAHWAGVLVCEERF